METTVAKRILDKFMENGNFPVPPNLLEGKVLQFAADNIDIIEETLDSKGTFHATQMVAFQRGEPTGQSEQQLPLGKGGSLKIPEELKKQLNHAPETIARPIPRFVVDVDLESYEPNPILNTTANIKDVCWLLTRHCRIPDQSVLAWMGFNQLSITNKQQVTFVSYLPIINASAHESTHEGADTHITLHATAAHEAGFERVSSRVETVMCWYL